MYLSAERLALANQAVRETFEQCSIAWQAIPHWDTGDPGQFRVPKDDPNAVPSFLDLDGEEEKFQLTVVQAEAPTPDLLLTEVIWQTGQLAKLIDGIVLKDLYNGRASLTTLPPPNPNSFADLIAALIQARANIEDAGYRAPSCLITNTDGLTFLSQLVSGFPEIDAVLTAANVNALHRATTIDPALAAGKKLFVMLGRRQLIAPGGGAQASPGEEPVDIAVSVPPGLELVGEAPNSEIEAAVRIRFVTRIKDAGAIVAIVDP